MSAILTLLFVRNTGEVCSPFIAPLQTAAIRLLVEHRTEHLKALLFHESVDAIILDQDHLQDSVMAELKLIAPRTPLILLRRNQEKTAKPPGIAAVFSADPGDENLRNAMPIFVSFILGKQTLNFRNQCA